MASNTLAAWVSKCSIVSNSISMLERIASGSPPSTSDCRPFFRNSSFSCFDRGLEPEQTLLARDVAPLDDLLDHRGRVVDRRFEHPRDDLPRAQEGRHRRLHQTRGHRAHDHDDECRAADQRAGAAAFQDRAADDRDQPEHDADDA